MPDMPVPKLTSHAKSEEPAQRNEVQKNSAGVLGKATVSMVAFAPAKSTIVYSSITAGRRQPETPPKVSEVQ